MQVLSENCSNKVRIGNIRFRRQVQAICLLAIGKIPAKLAKKWSLIFKTFLVPFQIYYNWLQLIFNTLLPLSSLIGMNIQIYLTMKGRWGDSSVDHFNRCDHLAPPFFSNSVSLFQKLALPVLLCVSSKVKWNMRLNTNWDETSLKSPLAFPRVAIQREKWKSIKQDKINIFTPAFHSNSPLGSEQDENKDKNCHLQVTDCSKGGKLKRKFTISFRSKGRDSPSSGHQRMIMRFSSKHQSVRCQQTSLAADQKVCPMTLLTAKYLFLP